MLCYFHFADHKSTWYDRTYWMSKLMTNLDENEHIKCNKANTIEVIFCVMLVIVVMLNGKG